MTETFHQLAQTSTLAPKELAMADTPPSPEALHVQISGGLPWCVLGWHTSQFDDVPDELVTAYGPVSTKEEAERLAEALAQAAPGSGESAKFTAMQIFPVQSAPATPDASR